MKPLDAIFTITALCLSQCSPFSLTVTPTKVKVGDEVDLECLGAKDAHPNIDQVLWIRVLRMAGGKWSRLAEHREKDACVISYGEISSDDVSVSSEVGERNRTYLKIKWRAAKEQIYGAYRCDVIGVNELEDIIVHSTDRVNVFKDGDCPDNGEKKLLRLLEYRSEELSMLIKSVQEKQLTLSAEVDRLRAKISPVNESGATLLVQTNDTLTDRGDKTTEALGYPQDSAMPDVNNWPRGSYSLLTSGETDCPDDSSDFRWTKTVHVFNMEMNNVTDVIGQTSPRFRSLYDVTGTSSSFNLTLCQTNRTHGPDWPLGTYCVGRLEQQCPHGFSSQFSRLTDLSGDSREDIHLWHFCCRSDGRHSVPVRLPTLFPFYLLRHGGECQAVSGMTSELEQFVIDTKNDDSLSSRHPEGRLNDVIIQLCYYEQNKH